MDMVPQDTLTPRQRAWIRAKSKAERLGVTPFAIFDDHSVYGVWSSAGGLYYVSRNEHSTVYTCSCPAGENQVPCYHAAAVAALPDEAARRAAYRRAAGVSRTQGEMGVVLSAEVAQETPTPMPAPDGRAA
jgi:hypothetical protein